MAKGQARKAIKTIISKTTRKASRNKSVIMSIDFIAIPINIENLIRPSRYSFFQGLKKVFIIKDKEKRLRKAIFSDEK